MMGCERKEEKWLFLEFESPCRRQMIVQQVEYNPCT